VVVGAGMSGLLSARVLAESFDRVTIVERDLLPEEPVSRKGVPQARHLHSLATRGSEILEDLFPGLDTELADAGCPLLDQAADAITELPAGRLPRFRSGITMRAASRAIIERHVRARLEADPRMRFLPNREAVGLIPGPDNSVSGIRTRSRADGSTENLMADLVLDASGSGSRSPRWLEELGYEPPEETVVDARLGYATRWYRVPEDFDGDWTGVAVLPGWPESTRGGTLRRVEGDLWTAVLIGTGGDYPPTDPAAFVEFAASLHSPAIHEAIKDAEPASPVYGYRRTANRLRHYEKTRLPANFLVAGDAACVLNPSYGHGMTAAALSALALRESLNGGRASNLSRRFQRRQRRAVAPCWTATTNSDAQWAAGGVDELGPVRRVLYRVSEEVMQLAVEREHVAATLLRVKNLISPSAALLRPGILVPALVRTVWYSAGSRPGGEGTLPDGSGRPKTAG
jgi:flavin-dependent dehydrogenase